MHVVQLPAENSFAETQSQNRKKYFWLLMLSIFCPFKIFQLKQWVGNRGITPPPLWGKSLIELCVLFLKQCTDERVGGTTTLLVKVTIVSLSASQGCRTRLNQKFELKTQIYLGPTVTIVFNYSPQGNLEGKSNMDWVTYLIFILDTAMIGHGWKDIILDSESLQLNIHFGLSAPNPELRPCSP